RQTEPQAGLARNPILEPSELVMHKVTLNLPRIAYLTAADSATKTTNGRIGEPVTKITHSPIHPFTHSPIERGNEGYLFQLLNTRVRLIAQAHLQKQVLINRLYGTRLINSVKAAVATTELKPVYAIGILGLNELVQSFYGSQLHQAEPAFRFGLKLLNELREQCHQLSQTMHLSLRLEPTYAPEISVRFAKLDLDRYYPFAAQVIKKKPTNGGGAYTLAANLAEDSDLDLLTRIDAETRFHAYLNHQGSITIPLSLIVAERSCPDLSGSRSGKDLPRFIGVKFLSFLKQLFMETNCQHLLLKK
ncbi:MAG: anaerobic ribonucleoside-triphosphate reductase, partial [bacterium]|nr:anaerobic ribonucleoside-triphosphate reductase [bacterium]